MDASKLNSSNSGFSIMELLIAMSITLVVMSSATTFLARSLRVRGREMARTAAIADAQRALNTMSREISNSGFGLTSNGIVTANSDASSIRRRANLNSYTPSATHTVTEQDEDVMFSLQANPDGTFALIRSDIGLGQARVLASPVQTLLIQYYNSASPPVEITDGSENNATRVQISLMITLPAVGKPGSPGYQPPSEMRVASDVTLRNSNLFTY